MSRYDSDQDWRDWRDGPYPDANAECDACHRPFYKGKDDLGNLCDACLYNEWVERKDRAFQAKQRTA